jgi:Aminoglycoside-2''-adenylyltransferase
MLATRALYGDPVHPDIEAWDAWHPRTLAERLADVPFPWCVAGGWAVDLFLGRATREHHDLEIAVPASWFARVPPRVPEVEFWVPHGEGALAPMSSETLAGPSHQTWAYERAAGRWRFDVFREPHDGDTWICRRDPTIRRPYADLVARTPDGIPYLAPEVVLLFKAKGQRPKDVADLGNLLPELAPERRAWLFRALGVIHPGHAWLERL